MALRRCRECTTLFAVGLPACPHCQSTDHEEDGAMPKITRHGGPSIAGDPDVQPEPEQADEESSPSSEAAEPGPVADYEAMTVEELKEELAERGLPKSGKRDELVQRPRDADAAETE